MIKISHRKLKCPKNQKFCISLVIFLPMDFLTNFISTRFFQFHFEGLYLSLLSQSPQSLVWKICYFCSQSWVFVMPIKSYIIYQKEIWKFTCTLDIVYADVSTFWNNVSELKILKYFGPSIWSQGLRNSKVLFLGIEIWTQSSHLWIEEGTQCIRKSQQSTMKWLTLTKFRLNSRYAYKTFTKT